MVLLSRKLMLAGALAAVTLGSASAMAAPWRDVDNNPPGPAGGPGTNWENPPGPAGGPGVGPDLWIVDTFIDPDHNPPGPAGGPGTNWENPPGPVGGPGASPDRGLGWF